MQGSLIDDVMLAMERHEIQAYYQPQYDVRNGSLVSAEALVRWQRQDGTVLPPSEFIPELEQSIAINALDWFIVEDVCKTLVNLGENAVPVAVNFSRWHVKESNFVNILDGILEEYGVSKNLIEIEITESAFTLNHDDVAEWANKIANRGYSIAIDDFGSGLSSIQYVKDLPISVLKIDKTFLDGNCQSPKGRKILEGIINFAHTIGLTSVVEGVETVEQLKFVQICGATKFQGYLFSKAVDQMSFMQLAVRNNRYAVDMSDILVTQDIHSSAKLLISALFKEFPFVVYGNLSKNSYCFLSEEHFTFESVTQTGEYDTLYEEGLEIREGEDRKAFEVFE